MNSIASSPLPTRRGALFPALLGWLAMTAILFGWSLIRVPIPGVNEPHYLAKARHYWEPNWAEPAAGPKGTVGDVFLDSSNPHQFFYATFGYLAHLLSFADAAWWGRLLGCAMVAAGWLNLSRALFCSDEAGPVKRLTWEPVLGSLVLFLLLQAGGSWSGEWLVGGIESKVPAYGLLFWGLAALLCGSWFQAGAACGLAVSFHPLAGGWGVVSIVLMLIWEWLSDRSHCPSVKTLSIATLLFVGAVLLGTIPALQLIIHTDPVQGMRADYLMVAHRLAHHLDPLAFPRANWVYFAFLLVIWLLLRCSHTTTIRWRRWELVVLASLLIAFTGVLVAWGPRPLKTAAYYALRVKVLKFYPFRLADLLLPVAVAFEVVDYLSRIDFTVWKRLPLVGQRLVLAATCLLVFVWSATLPGSDRRPSGMSPAQEADWIAACRWVRENTPANAVVHATNERWAVKWYTERSEYFNYKDCPQDAASLMEWNRRQWVLSDWQTATFQDWNVSREELAALHAETGITHLIVSRMGPFDDTPVFIQGAFKVYALPKRNE